MATAAIFVGLLILCVMNPLLFFALAPIWWGSGVLARRQGLLMDSRAEEVSVPTEPSEVPEVDRAAPPDTSS